MAKLLEDEQERAKVMGVAAATNQAERDAAIKEKQHAVDLAERLKARTQRLAHTVLTHAHKSTPPPHYSCCRCSTGETRHEGRLHRTRPRGP
jgi:hypothetical protein